MIKFIFKQIKDIKFYGAKEFYRKFYLLINYILIFLMDLMAIIPCIIIRLIRPWYLIRVEPFPVTSFGDFVTFPAIYCCKKKFQIDQPNKKYIDLVYIHKNDKVYNKQLAKMWKRKFNFLPSYLLDPIYRINKIIPGGKVHRILVLCGKSRDINNMFEKYQPLKFTSEEKSHGQEILKKFGLKNNDKFVCLAVRDSGYQKKKISPRFRDWSRHDYRNWNIDNFILAAEELTKKGYFVFRMGVSVEKPFNSKNPKIIDYANSQLRSDFMDIYLAASCSFCVSTGFGFQDLAVLFRKHLVELSVPLAALLTFKEKFLVMTKHHICKKENRMLNFSEIFSHGVAYALDSNIFKNKEIELKDNTPEEIKDLVSEMVEILETNKKNPEDDKLQEIFRNLYDSNLKRPDPLKESLGYWKDFIHHGEIRARYGSKFLRQNKNWLK